MFTLGVNNIFFRTFFISIVVSFVTIFTFVLMGMIFYDCLLASLMLC